jgi:hypothetical protein
VPHTCTPTGIVSFFFPRRLCSRRLPCEFLARCSLAPAVASAGDYLVCSLVVWRRQVSFASHFLENGSLGLLFDLVPSNKANMRRVLNSLMLSEAYFPSVTFLYRKLIHHILS